MFTDDNGDSDDDNSSRFRSNWYFCGRQGGGRGVITFSSELLFYKVPWTTSSPPPTAPTIPPMNKSFTQNTVLIKYVTEDFPPPKKNKRSRVSDNSIHAKDIPWQPDIPYFY